MDALLFRDKTYRLDRHGFLADQRDWDHRFAEGMADRLGLDRGLTLMHWRMVLFVRKRFECQCQVPRIHEACRACGFSRARLLGLFPPGYQRGVCRTAGIPYTNIVDLHFALTGETAEPRGPRYEMTPHGFLRDFARWDDGFAIRVAASEHVPLMTAEHWHVIDYLRERYSESGEIPTVSDTCRDLRLTLRDWRRLFPAGYRNGAWRMAGLPAVLK